MKIHSFLFASLVATTHCLASASERLIIDVAHDLDAARPSETIAIPWPAVNKALPGALLQHIAVTDAAGHVLPCQVTNIHPEAKDPGNAGIAKGWTCMASARRSAPAVPVVKTQPPANSHALAQWVTQRGHGDFGTAIIVPGATAVAYAEDGDNALILATAASGKPLRYYLGAAAGWWKNVHDQADWHRKVDAKAARIAAPIGVTLSTANQNTATDPPAELHMERTLMPTMMRRPE